MKKAQKNSMIAMLAMAVAISLAIFASDTVSLTVTKDNASVDGKWDPITGQNPEVRNINVTAGAGVTLNKDGTVKNSDTTGCSVAISPNDEEHCNATCTLDPTAPYHKAHTTGHYSFGGGGEGSLPEWNAIATAPTVKITKCPDKMLVEGKFDVEADGQPKIEGEKYDWSFTGPGPKDTAFNPDPSADGKTKFTPDEITKTGQQSFVNVKYADAIDKKEAKITRCEYFKKKSGGGGLFSTQLAPYVYFNSCGITKGANNVVAYGSKFVYVMFDQYKQDLFESHYGDAFPYVKETLNVLKNNFTHGFIITKKWEKIISNLPPDNVVVRAGWNSLIDKDDVQPFNLAIDLNHTWHASVEEGKHSTPVITNSFSSYYGFVFRNWRTGELQGFTLNSIYILDFETIM